MAWTFRAILSKWKPTAKCVVACLLKCAGGVAAAADPENELLYKCLAAGTEQSAEHLFDTLPDDQKHAVENRFALLQPYLNQHAGLIHRLESLAEQQTNQNHSVEALTEFIRVRLPAELQPDLQRCLLELGNVQNALQKIHRNVLRRLKRLEKTVARNGKPTPTTVIPKNRATELAPTGSWLPHRDDQGPTLFLQAPEPPSTEELPTRDEFGPVLFPCVSLPTTNDYLST